MSATDINAVLEKFDKATTLGKSELNFAGKGLKLNTEDDAKVIVSEIETAGSVQILRLEGNTFGVDACKAIGKALEKRPELERAKWSDMFTGRLKSEIPQALQYLGAGMMVAGAELVELDLSDNAFGPNGMNGLLDFLKSKSCYKLRELRLNNNGLGTTGGKMLAECLLECHQRSSAAGTPLALRVFVSGRGRLEDDGSIALAKAFKVMGSLEELQMPQNGITHLGIAALADALAANKNLHILNLNDNTFTERGAAAMAKTLPNLEHLEVLNFGDCLLRTAGACSIATAIKTSHTTLKTIVLSFNEIKSEGGKAIAEAMENKTNLDKVDLDGNQLGEEGTEMVRTLMEAAGKADQLGSLSEDEGSDDEDDEEDEEEEQDDEGEVCGEGAMSRDLTMPQDLTMPPEGVTLTPRAEAKPVSAFEFLQFPSPNKLEQIGSNRSQAIIEQLGDDVRDIDKAVKAIMKISSIVTSDDENTFTLATECADAIFQKLLEGETSKCCLLSNSLLVHMGLLKSEEKLPTPSNIMGPLLVLDHSIRQSYFPKSVKDILQIFISRPHPLLEKSSKAQHQMLQTMHQF